MKSFIARFGSQVTAVLSGFDRLVFRGTLLPLVRDFGMFYFLQRAGIRLLDFKEYVRTTTKQIKAATLADVRNLGRPELYLGSSKTSKEDVARKLLAKHPVKEGLICALRTVEPCMSFEYHCSKDPRERGLRLVPSKCLHIYKYFLDPRFGFMNARIQTWFPFNIQICLNGREWLSRDLAKKGSAFKRADNAFTWLEDAPLAQRLMDKQLETDWPGALSRIARSMNPLHRKIFEPYPMDYYWSAYQTEWATDLLFLNPATLAKLYPALVRHAMLHFKSPDVMRFLGRKEHGNFTGELTTSFKNRPEGVRVKHWVRGNSIKMYDKAGSILRVETTIAAPKCPIAPTNVISKPSPPSKTPRLVRRSSTSSPSPSLRTNAAPEPCASGIPPTWPSSRPLPVASSPPTTFRSSSTVFQNAGSMDALRPWAFPPAWARPGAQASIRSARPSGGGSRAAGGARTLRTPKATTMS